MNKIKKSPAQGGSALGGKKILIFSLTYMPFVGGAEIAIDEITKRVSSNDFTFDLITLRLDSRLAKFERVGNINVYRVGFAKNKPKAGELLGFPMYLVKVFYPILAFFKAISLDRKEKYYCVWSMMAYMGFPAVLLKMLYRNIPYILTLQEGDNIYHIKDRKRIRMVGFLFKKIFTMPDVVQTISTYLADLAKSMGYKGHVEVIPNGVDFSLFSEKKSEIDLEKLMKSIGIDKNNKIIITTSRLVEKNAVNDVIESLTFLPNNFKLLILGSGPDLDKLKTLVENLNLDGRVLFLGHTEHDDIPPYLQISDIFIRPSLSEGMGNSFIEAMASGIPVIATKVGGITDFLFDPKESNKPTGLFVEVKNPQDIAEKMKILIEDKELSSKLTQNAKELVSQKYDWDLISRNMENRVFSKVSA